MVVLLELLVREAAVHVPITTRQQHQAAQTQVADQELTAAQADQESL